MTHEYIEVPAEIDKYPPIDQNLQAENGALITIGDLHANAINFSTF
jgi:hypothetical protein